MSGVNAVVTDFAVGQDRLRFENLGKGTPKVTVENGNTVVSLGGSKVTLVGVKSGRLKPGDVVVF